MMGLKDVNRFSMLQKPLRCLKSGLQLLKLCNFFVCPLQFVTNEVWLWCWQYLLLLRGALCPFLDYLLCIYNQTTLQESLDRYRKFFFVWQELWGYKLSACSNYSCICKGNPMGVVRALLLCICCLLFEEQGCSANPAWAEEQQWQSSSRTITGWGVPLSSLLTTSDKKHRPIYDLLSSELWLATHLTYSERWAAPNISFQRKVPWGYWLEYLKKCGYSFKIL